MEKCAGLLYTAKLRSVSHPAKKLSEILTMADGARRERPMEKSLPRCLSFSVKQKRKQMHMEGGGGRRRSHVFFVTGSREV